LYSSDDIREAEAIATVSYHRTALGGSNYTDGGARYGTCAEWLADWRYSAAAAYCLVPPSLLSADCHLVSLADALRRCRPKAMAIVRDRSPLLASGVVVADADDCDGLASTF